MSSDWLLTERMLTKKMFFLENDERTGFGLPLKVRERASPHLHRVIFAPLRSDSPKRLCRTGLFPSHRLLVCAAPPRASSSCSARRHQRIQSIPACAFAFPSPVACAPSGILAVAISPFAGSLG
jgi:hypothetical protein